jgi:oligosaccharide repeat unit polymerase
MRKSLFTLGLSVTTFTLLSLGLLFAFISESASVLLFVLALVIWLLILVNLPRKEHPIELTAEVLVHGLFGFYFLIPAAQEVFGDTNTDDDLLTRSLFCIVVGLVGFAASILMPWKLNLEMVLPNLDGTWEKKEASIVGFGLIAIGVVLLAILVQQVGLSTFAASDYGSQYNVMRGKGTLAAGGNLIKVGLLILFLADATPKGKTPLSTLILFVIFTLTLFRIGRRHLVLSIGLGLLTIKHQYIKRIPLSVFAIGAAASLVVFTIVGTARSRMSDGADEMLTFVQEDFSSDWLWRVTDEPGAVMLTLRETIARQDSTADYEYGLTFVESFVILIPLVLLPDRPLTPSQDFARTYAPIRAQAGAGFSFSLLAEGYQNGGIFGAFFVCFIIGLFLRSLTIYQQKFPQSKGRILFYAAWMTVAVVFVRGDSSGLLKAGFFVTVLPAILAGYWLGRKRRTAVAISRADRSDEFLGLEGHQ